jgi:hypothetical protein
LFAEGNPVIDPADTKVAMDTVKAARKKEEAIVAIDFIWALTNRESLYRVEYRK